MNQIIQASFYWRNDKPGGIGFTFGPPSFTPKVLTEMFEPDNENIRGFFRESDKALGSQVVKDYLAQLEAIGQMKGRGVPIPQAIMAALNIMWLSSRGFIPNDEFNGVQFIRGQLR